MLYTDNFKLNKPEDNDNYNIENENYNMNIIDKGIAPFYVATLNSTNIYKINTGLNLTTLQDGFSIKIAIPSGSTESTSLIVDNITAIQIKKVNGNSVTNLKANGVYSLTYYNSVFILASGGVDGDKVTASEANVLLNKTYIGSDEEIHIGTMSNNGVLNASIGVNGTYNIPKGYTDGGKITQNITNNGALNSVLGINGTYNIPAGYTSGGKVTQSISTQAGSTTTPGTSDKTIVAANKYVTGNIIVKGDVNLIASNILNGKSIFGVAGSAQELHEASGTVKSGVSVTLGFTPKIIYGRISGSLCAVYSPIGTTFTESGGGGMVTISVSGNSFTLSNSGSTSTNFTYYAVG